MTSPYKTRPMANTVEMQISQGCKSYDLYVTSEFRRSMFVEGKMKDGDTTVRLSTLNMMYNDNREKYDETIKSIFYPRSKLLHFNSRSYPLKNCCRLGLLPGCLGAVTFAIKMNIIIIKSIFLVVIMMS